MLEKSETRAKTVSRLPLTRAKSCTTPALITGMFGLFAVVAASEPALRNRRVLRAYYCAIGLACGSIQQMAFTYVVAPLKAAKSEL